MSALTDWSDGEITELMAERDAAIRERDAAIASLTIQRDAAEEGANSAIQMRNESLARAHAAEALARESGRQVVDGISAMLTIANQRDAAIRERDEALRQLESSRLCVRSLTDTKQAVAEMRAAANDAMTEVQRDAALAILRDLVTSWDGADDFDCEVIVARARKLLGDI